MTQGAKHAALARYVYYRQLTIYFVSGLNFIRRSNVTSAQMAAPTAKSYTWSARATTVIRGQNLLVGGHTDPATAVAWPDASALATGRCVQGVVRMTSDARSRTPRGPFPRIRPKRLKQMWCKGTPSHQSQQAGLQGRIQSHYRLDQRQGCHCPGICDCVLRPMICLAKGLQAELPRASGSEAYPAPRELLLPKFPPSTMLRLHPQAVIPPEARR